MHHHSTTFAHRNARTQARGFTLIELLVSMVIALVILGGASAVFLSTTRTSGSSETDSKLNEEGILALNIIQNQIKLAGYSQQIVAPPNPRTATFIGGNFGGAAVRGCDGGFTDINATFNNLTCANGAGSDSIAVRYEGNSSNTIPTKAAPNLPSNCVGESIAAATAPSVTASVAAAANYSLVENRFYVSRVASSTDDSLYCKGPSSTGQPIIPGVEFVDIRYGIAAEPSLELVDTYSEANHQIVNYVNASAVEALSASSAALNPAVNDRWGRVLGIRVCIIMRSAQAIKDAAKYTNGNPLSYRNCDNINTDNPTGDFYLRRAFTSTVMLRNRMVSP